MKKTTTTKVEKTIKVSKHKLVKAHLIKNKSITSWVAIELYGATRLSAIIFNLRNEAKMNIVTKPIVEKDRYGNVCTFAKYVLLPTPSKK